MHLLYPGEHVGAGPLAPPPLGPAEEQGGVGGTVISDFPPARGLGCLLFGATRGDAAMTLLFCNMGPFQGKFRIKCLSGAARSKGMCL